MLERWHGIRKYLQYNLLLVWRTRDFWLRAIACWFVGIFLLSGDESHKYDFRLQARGPRPAHSRIVIVDLGDRDWLFHERERQNILRPLKEIVSYNDTYFWHPKAWERILSRLLEASPHAIGVTLYFGDPIRSERLSAESRRIFEDPRVVWAADIDSNGRILVPIFATTYNTNVGLRELRADDDGVVRRFTSSYVQVPHIASRLAALADSGYLSWENRPSRKSALINFSGDKNSFTVLNVKDVLEGKFSPDLVRDSVVLIGPLSAPSEMLQTPLGRMSRTEVIANITDTLLARKIIYHWPTPVYISLLALLMAGSIWVLVTYPQSVTLVTFVMTAIVWTAASTWAFDTWFIWIPIFSPLAQLTVTCIVFLSYQLAINERRTWSLQQEQRYRNEIEQLKTNFVSMMSHDLKTPIAKIQAICDRLLFAVSDPVLVQDLKNLRRASDELHRYIQSILQVTKIEAKEFRIRKEVTDINDNIERVVARLRPLAAEKNLRIETQLEPMFSIEADTTLIQEVIHNLIENAIKYTPKPDSESGQTGVVRVISQEKDDMVVVTVEDNGPGIDPADHENVWKKFTRGRDQVSNTETKGTGLGLYLVKYFIELHGGQVFLESELGKGTRIGFMIPIASEQTDENPESPTSVEPSGQVSAV